MSGAAYVALFLMSAGSSVWELCGSLTLAELGKVILTSPWAISPAALAADWGLMVVAMMTPLTTPQLAYVRRSVGPGFGAGATMSFLGAYWSIWCLSTVILVPLAMLLMALTGDRLGLPAVLLVAVIHSMSPLAQRARNACHHTVRISPFGASAWADSAGQGFATGLRCLAACWPWMLIPLVVTHGHTAVMMLIGFYLFADRIAPPASLAWRIPPAFETLFGPNLLRQGLSR